MGRVDGYKVLTVLQCACFRPLFTTMRAASTSSGNFAKAATRLMNVLAEEAIAGLPSRDVQVATPCGTYEGQQLEFTGAEVCAVSILRAADALLASVRGVWPEVSVGKILIQRDEETAMPKLFYCKLPPSIAEKKHVMLLDPMLATGGSAIMALKCMTDAGVPVSRITFLCVVATKQGVAAVLEAFPGVKIVTAALDEGLDHRGYIVPGLGDYGDRFFGTDS